MRLRFACRPRSIPLQPIHPYFCYLYLLKLHETMYLRPFIASIIILLALPRVFSQNQPPSLRTASYDMQVRLDTAQKKVFGNEILYWKNPSADTVRELQFHLYYNAFKNTESTFVKEQGGFGLFLEAMKEHCGWSWMDIQSMRDEYGNDLTQQMHFIHPDDDNAEDQTVLRVPLPRPVLPGASIRVELEWVAKLPRSGMRTGYKREYYFMAQWFPKVGVYEPAGTRFAEKGQWNCHQYHANVEYYSDFGLYNVAITVPKGFVVGASGTLMGTKEAGDTQTWTYQAEDVIDFTWTASPHFVEVKEEYKGIQLRLLFYPYHLHLAPRYLTVIHDAIDFCAEHFGPYPYPGLTIVDPPLHGTFSSAMEYPSIITTAAVCVLPQGVKTPEILIAHEFVHQYFGQVVATNEQEEAWLDEGITNYYEARIMDEYYGSQTSTIDFLGFKMGNMNSNRADFFGLSDPQVSEIARTSWQFKEASYHTITYSKTTLLLRTLEGMVGTETLDEIMRTYYERWKFRHPGGKDFIAVANEVVFQKFGPLFGENLDWFFEQGLYGTGMCDYAVAAIANTPKPDRAGIFKGLDHCVQPVTDTTEEAYHSVVTLHRLGELRFPLEVRIQFEDGKTITEQWDGKARSKEFSYEGTTKVVSAEIDPEQKIYLDKNFLNNSLNLEPERAGVRQRVFQFMLWMQQIMQSISVFA